jgi:hypothetical protein
MGFSHDVQFWKLARLASKKGRRRPHGVRWVVAGKSFSKWFEYDAQADNYRSSSSRPPARARASTLRLAFPSRWRGNSKQSPGTSWPAGSPT